MDLLENPWEIDILVVDDDISICNLITDILKREDFSHFICNHPSEALEFLKDHNFSMAFVDINLPDMNGLELATKLKEHNPSGEVVFITGYGSFDNAVQAIKIGAYDYLRKPFGVNELMLCLKRFQERRVLRERVRRAEQRYFQLVQNIPVLVFIIRNDLKLEFINRSCEPMLGFTAQEALGEPDWFLGRIHPEDRERMKRLFLSGFKSRTSRFSTECRLLHREGHNIHVAIGGIAQANLDEGTDSVRIEGIMFDITDRVSFEKAAVQKEKLRILGSISAEVAHEIRNPLVSIGGFARRLRKRLPELPEGDIILKESERLEKILKRISAYLKPVDVSLQKCSINNIISQCVDDIEIEYGRESPRFKLNLGEDIENISIDKDILSRVFMDLIRNGINVGEKGGGFQIRTFETEMNLHIEFINESGKISSIDQESFLMPFSSSYEEVGLPLSYRLLKDMGGLLSFSQKENKMTFTVTLPKKTKTVSDIDGALDY